MIRRGTRRPTALVLAVLAIAGLLTLAVPVASAEAAATSCPGRKVRTLTFDTGTVRVYRKGGRYVCVVLVPGKQARKGAIRIRARGGRWVRNEASPTGPVTVHAGRRAVRIKARAGGETFDSGWILR
ncbi:hypothetical protein SAMN04487980_102370 [Streptomyces sp. cf124]|uniref:hypothetical protein n=1 Tax=Streptomyces sp. cf124 TaxID=1761903 RepID=UPI0008EA9830|nr:hypothetical protein [Streptomyces sp. cf124]SFN53905.1 hypothetical protein SAMN04487980_102370 [Streptomyces sp. cf124]